MHSETAGGLIADVGRLMGLPSLQLDDSGLCELVVDDRWRITVAHHRARNCLLLHSAICEAEVVEKMDRSTLLMMLKANFVGSGAGGAVFSIGTDGRVALQLELPLGRTSDQAVLQAIGQMLHEAEAWSARVAVNATGSQASPSKPRAPRIKMMA